MDGVIWCDNFSRNLFSKTATPAMKPKRWSMVLPVNFNAYYVILYGKQRPWLRAADDTLTLMMIQEERWFSGNIWFGSLHLTQIHPTVSAEVFLISSPFFYALLPRITSQLNKMLRWPFERHQAQDNVFKMWDWVRRLSVRNATLAPAAVYLFSLHSLAVGLHALSLFILYVSFMFCLHPVPHP